MHVIAHYRVADHQQFERTVAPYVYGSGEHARDVVTSAQWQGDGAATLEVTAASVSQFVTAAIGMLRFASGSSLERLDVIEATSPRSRDPFPARAVTGAILKPALADVAAHRAFIERAISEGMDFVKDDDVTEFSTERTDALEATCGGRIMYFRKTSALAHATSVPVMVVPWIDGWPLAERFAADIGAPLLIHPANTPTTISWEAHVTLGRLIGACAVVVPDARFDPSANLDAMLRAATAPNGGISPTRLLLAGGITPQRIEEITRAVRPDAHRHLGFTIGSWLTRA
jgi:hypothetical protein